MGGALTDIYDNGVKACISKRSDEINFDIIFGVSLIVKQEEDKSLKLKEDDEIEFKFIYHFKKARLDEQKPFEILCVKTTKNKEGNYYTTEIKQEEKINNFLKIIRDNKIYPVAYYHGDFFTKFPEEIPFSFKNENQYSEELLTKFIRKNR